MNLRNVLRAFTLLRQLTDDESALLATLRGMSEPEREALVVAMQPERTTAGKKKATKKTGSKSPRASAMAATLGKNLAQQRAVSAATCDRVFAGARCGLPESDPLHEKGAAYLDAHPFVSSSTVRPAAEKSSTSDDGASSGTDSDDASVAVGAGD
jgi:hypothetical protein